ncbi:hypothetical protein LE181_15200 [Streptomyces sp. SCA3-4]|uniref:hypothetical protein n=1 Tax=Streptomyces sichuanensis TaxID=2871810 RepID=UPI001CE24916|nr:hypothetical protein [Streptomyces sichuanensis]MCA6093502.1 hypothetical protein [Streptomyces sichuanensis]
MTSPPPDPTPVALELERLHRSVEVGFARLDGQLALLVQRSDQTDGRLVDLDARVDELERARWPLPSVAAVVALAALLLSLWQTIAH